MFPPSTSFALEIRAKSNVIDGRHFRRRRARCYKASARASQEAHAAAFVPLRGRGEMVDARDLKSLGGKPLCRFESGRPHQYKAIRDKDQ
jgi:hypothetical protein